ncbi:hypothetical protein BSL82_10070 [Tardibacter chloracetimidivorans]|uniref:Peptidase S24/S26A/S26B/S26C domain-containing protein n=1 Tax=Tardibacter chloracetimidivorans TaxID=1921510 RepID=A0A1L3ZVL3_9SPHN|nr:S24 family peptidase [Tardibacter chloracetimidivorans]API59619.1 hypothetical protein BSL82_10070 [Tardibacter chloracetimidivorans]
MEPTEIIARLKALGVPAKRVAEAIGRSPPVASKLLGATGEGRALKAHEIAPLIKLIREYEADTAAPAALSEYVMVDVLPTYAGMGGGGSADEEHEQALVPRRLVEEQLRGRAQDFVLVNARGDSMAPDFEHEDQVLVDKRDRLPTQPGPFVLWDGDGYVIKNLSRSVGRMDVIRVASSNSKYPADELPADSVHILGRPVWYGRRL